MSEAKPPLKMGHPASVAGLTTGLVGASALLPEQWREAWIFGATFTSPFLVELVKMIYFRINLDPELIQYNAALKRDLKQIRKELKRKDLTEDFRSKLVESEQEIVLLSVSAHRDYASGRLSLKKASLD